jgi:hypothetical protein
MSKYPCGGQDNNMERTTDAEYAIGVTRDPFFQHGLFINENQSKTPSSTSDTAKPPVPPPAHAVCLILKKIKTIVANDSMTKYNNLLLER